MAGVRADVLIFFGALLLRLLYVASIRHTYFFQHLQTEPLRYQRWAALILDAPQPPLPPYDEAPAYPFLLAGVYALCGRSTTPVAIIQSVCDALTCVGIALLGR